MSTPCDLIIVRSTEYSDRLALLEAARAAHYATGTHKAFKKTLASFASTTRVIPFPTDQLAEGHKRKLLAETGPNVIVTIEIRPVVQPVRHAAKQLSLFDQEGAKPLPWRLTPPDGYRVHTKRLGKRKQRPGPDTLPRSEEPSTPPTGPARGTR
jgi:hypothetical protein